MSSKADQAASLYPVDSAIYRRACARFATGITVVTVADVNGRPHGTTVNSFTSVSLSPPLVLVSLDLRSAILERLLASKHFGINILAEDQATISRQFSQQHEDRFTGVEWCPSPAGAPLIAGVLAYLDCRTLKSFEAGDHLLVLGEVAHAGFREGKPLVFFNSGYAELA